MGNADALCEVASMAEAAHAPFFLLKYVYAWLLRVDFLRISSSTL
jgi:hypothetical protein